MDATTRRLAEYSTNTGTTYREIAAYPRGHSKHPRTDFEVDDKLSALDRGVMDEAAAERLRRGAWSLDELRLILDLLDLLCVH